MGNFENDLAALINRHSKENASGTPDFILAAYLCACLEAYAAASRDRERFYGRAAEPLGTTGVAG